MESYSVSLIVSLILVPAFAAVGMLLAKRDGVRDALCIGFAVAIGALSVLFSAHMLGQGSVFFSLPISWSGFLSAAALIIDLAVAAFIICYAVKYKRWLALAMAVVQLVLLVIIEGTTGSGHTFSSQMHVDGLSIIMVLVIGIIGSGICVYALGYMKDFQNHHPDQPDRRPWFFALMFVFLSAMFNLVLADNLNWIYTAWEVTTLCSFLLIGFTKTQEAINNAFRQIVMNMLGGIAFQIAIMLTLAYGQPALLSDFVTSAASGLLVLGLPVALLAFAAMTKAAQMPFHTWLLGAMVAPTPTSALLHSSTMVKAGVYLLIRLAPAFLAFPFAQWMVIIIGGVTFLAASLLAISQTNAKRVLAYSTIANLGLITACAGVGTPEALWAGIFLLIFHAVAKSLLFLCVGTAEHHIGSRDIEDMDLLFERMPKLARLMMLGMLCMFIAPFGMLLAKWAALVSFVETSNFLLLGLLLFGSAATFLFWAKWMGKIAGIAQDQESIEGTVHRSEWVSLNLMAVLICACCILMPFMSMSIVDPFLKGVYVIASAPLTFGDMRLMAVLVVFVVLVLFGVVGFNKSPKAAPYLSGATLDASSRVFKNSFSKPTQATLRNLYLEDMFGEKVLDKPVTIIAALIMVVGIAGSFLAPGMFDPQTIAGSLEANAISVPRLCAGLIAFGLLGPIAGCLLAGIDRKLSARMQGRVGPPLLQPYYDVRKLLSKRHTSVNHADTVYVFSSLIFVWIAGGVFFAGGNFLLCVFLVTIAALFFILAAYSARSPYAQVGADRETLQVMAYEPAVLLCAIAMFGVAGTFNLFELLEAEAPLVIAGLPAFVALMFVLTIKLRKSPFDLSYSHHAHQELVKGVTTEMSGPTLAMVEITHWMESVLFLGWVGMFFLWSNPASIAVAVLAAIAAFVLEIFIDNNFARVKWQSCLRWSWGLTLACAVAMFVIIAIL